MMLVRLVLLLSSRKYTLSPPSTENPLTPPGAVARVIWVPDAVYSPIMPRLVSATNKSPKGSTATFHGESSVSSGPTTCRASVATFKSYTALHGSGLQYDSSATYRFWPAASTEIPRGDTAPPEYKVVSCWLLDCHS